MINIEMFFASNHKNQLKFSSFTVCLSFCLMSCRTMLNNIAVTDVECASILFNGAPATLGYYCRVTTVIIEKFFLQLTDIAIITSYIFKKIIIYLLIISQASI